MNILQKLSLGYLKKNLTKSHYSELHKINDNEMHRLATQRRIENVLLHLFNKEELKLEILLLVIFYMWLSCETAILGISDEKIIIWENNLDSILRIIVAKIKAILLELDTTQTSASASKTPSMPLISELISNQHIKQVDYHELTKDTDKLQKYRQELLAIINEEDISSIFTSEMLFMNWVFISISINGISNLIYQKIIDNIEIVSLEIRNYLLQIL